MDLFLFEKIAVARLGQRRVDDGSPGVRLRMPDGQGDVRLAAHEWDALGDWFRVQITPSARRLRLAVVLTLPLIIAFLAVIANVPVLKSAFERVFDAAPALFMLFLCGALPLTMTALHALAVQRAVDGVNEALADRPRLGTSCLPPRRALNAMELIALVLVGPHLILGLWGSVFPGAFLNTPWSGTRLDAFGVAGIAVFLLLGFLRWRRSRPPRPTGDDVGRSVDIVARAKETAP